VRLIKRVACFFALLMTSRILCLRTGNDYRSRYAEQLFNHRAKSEGLDWRATSKGSACSAENIGPMDAPLLSARSRVGPDQSEPHSTNADSALLPLARLLLRGELLKREIEQRFPEAAGRVTYLHVDDIEFAHESIALAMIDDQDGQLISTLRLDQSS
jgi:protein-tyrosine phosphatase